MIKSSVTSAFGEHGVSIESMRQGVRRSEDGLASLTFMTHQAPEAALAATVAGCGGGPGGSGGTAGDAGPAPASRSSSALSRWQAQYMERGNGKWPKERRLAKAIWARA